MDRSWLHLISLLRDRTICFYLQSSRLSRSLPALRPQPQVNCPTGRPLMNGSLRALALLLLATPLATFADQLIPAGSLLQCTVSEPKLSSKTAAIGDPVLCQVSHVELYGRSVFPTGSYLVGHFEDYKDPGHFVGKGWMELKFDRMTLPADEVIPVDAKVVYVPHYPVDRDGRI